MIWYKHLKTSLKDIQSRRFGPPLANWRHLEDGVLARLAEGKLGSPCSFVVVPPLAAAYPLSRPVHWGQSLVGSVHTTLSCHRS